MLEQEADSTQFADQNHTLLSNPFLSVWHRAERICIVHYNRCRYCVQFAEPHTSVTPSSSLHPCPAIGNRFTIQFWTICISRYFTIGDQNLQCECNQFADRNYSCLSNTFLPFYIGFLLFLWHAEPQQGATFTKWFGFTKFASEEKTHPSISCALLKTRYINKKTI